VGLRCGWAGPSVCALCKNVEETSSHIFFDCVYAIQVSRIVYKYLKASSLWPKVFLEDNLKGWLVDKSIKQLDGVPSILVNSLWWAHNSSVFKDRDILPEVTVGIILNLANELLTDLKFKEPRLPSMPDLDFNIPWGFFDSAAQGNPNICRVCVVLYLHQNHYLQACYS
jgi:hypothetical protein